MQNRSCNLVFWIFPMEQVGLHISCLLWMTSCHGKCGSNPYSPLSSCFPTKARGGDMLSACFLFWNQQMKGKQCHMVSACTDHFLRACHKWLRLWKVSETAPRNQGKHKTMVVEKAMIIKEIKNVHSQADVAQELKISKQMVSDNVRHHVKIQVTVSKAS